MIKNLPKKHVCHCLNLSFTCVVKDDSEAFSHGNSVWDKPHGASQGEIEVSKLRPRSNNIVLVEHLIISSSQHRNQQNRDLSKF